MTSPVSAPTRALRDGFDVCFLRNEQLEVAVVPELGAKVVSLKNRRTGREWMYHPPATTRLFLNKPGDDFARSPLVGWDECLPTVIPCQWRGRSLPDHGEAWSAAWQLDEDRWKQGVIKTTVRLPVSPFEFSRSIALEGDTLNVDYRLVSMSDEPQEYLWVMHPLLALHPGDRLVLTPEISAQLEPAPWLETLDFADPVAACAKVFVGPLWRGRAEICNEITDDRLIFNWDAAECNMLGIWLTRGGWNGHHHLALEPANGDHDSLAVAADRGKGCGLLPSREEKTWRIQIQIPSAAVAP